VLLQRTLRCETLRVDNGQNVHPLAAAFKLQLAAVRLQEENQTSRIAGEPPTDTLLRRAGGQSCLEIGDGY
jgi:hypothetical protein